jgi:hypothetical protein
LEGYEGTIAAGESDMGVPHKNAVSVMCSVGGSCPVTMERNQYISPRDAEVSSPMGPISDFQVNCVLILGLF